MIDSKGIMMKRIAFFQSELSVGGIQKSLVNLLRSIDYDKYEVDLYLSKNDNFWNVTFPERLNVHFLKKTPKLFSFIPFETAKSILRYNFDAGREYDLAVDFNSYQCSCAIGAQTVPAKYRVMWIHNNVEIKYANEWKYRVLWFFFKEKFKYYDEFVPVSESITEPFKEMSGIKDKPFTVIQNIINVDEIREKMEHIPENFSVSSEYLNFVALGRLCHQKGYDIMLEEFAKALNQRRDIRLYIIGDGPDEEALKRQCGKLGIEKNVFFLGRKSNPYCYMKLMDAFISTSRYEGQPLNIMEAMAVGLPLYCSKNLESYTEGLKGYDDIAAAIVSAEREQKHPDDLTAYNSKILDSIYKLAERAEKNS